MRRREFISLGSAFATWPMAARAQQAAMPVIGFVSNVPRQNYARLMPALSQGLTGTGFVEGQNVVFDYRWIKSEHDLPALAAEMVARSPSVIFAVGGTASALALKNATGAVPIIFIIGSDPVKFGLVKSLNQPGGNLTGVTSLSNSLAAKQLEMLHELVPNGAIVGVLVNPENPNTEDDTKNIRTAAETLGHKLIVLTAKSGAELNSAIAASTANKLSAMLVASDLFFLSRRTQIVTLSARYGLLTMYDRPEFVFAGGLMSYGSNRNEIFRQAGVYAGRILKGEKPADLPVQQATRLELVINLQTANALGIDVPATLLAQADDVIE